MKFLIDKQYMLHEGGTKFYQVLRVRSLDDVAGRALKNVTVTNWGAHSGEVGAGRRIVVSGETQVKAGDLYQTTIKVKKGRGYAADVEWGVTKNFANEDAMNVWLTAEVGAAEAAKIRALLEVSAAPVAVDGVSRDEHERLAARAALEVPESSSLPGWGEF